MPRDGLAGKVAMVTGATRGIGEAIAKRLLLEGCTVAAVDIQMPSWEDDNCNFVTIQADVAVEEEVERAVAQVVHLFGGLDIYVNNAALFVFSEVTQVTEADMDATFGTNVKGYVWGTKHAAAAMRANGGNCKFDRLSPGGSVVNVGSISSVVAQPGFIPYSATKGAILQLTRCSALDLAKFGIRVNAVCPGPILTDGTAKHAASQGKSVEQASEEMCQKMLCKRMGTCEEVASAVAFLASTDASFINGATLMVDGGYTCL